MKLICIVLALILTLIVILYLFPQINFREMPKGLVEGQLPDDKPNWVSSLVNESDSHYIVPLKVESMSELAACIESKVPELKIQKQDASLLIGYRQSRIFHFVDWLCIHADGNVISSATMGYSDFGKNRELVEKIRSQCS
ncbi:DUF1499 domain-containing protein [Legionella pneumophila]|uniref:Uncharacterized protein conserved in bacteria n=1 Tax=Legionella pneumophila subsp. pascullei TaxID=91890 RepID=A0AAX2IU27_LEGPN|nr:DUF1499 domain-containing protein [Legionella pneumophila]AMP90676.1 hypothetical protein AXF35_13630 [Legionella pneumophila subsp. pascullei]AMP91634.1 hypothetical protein AXF36_03040 [Legionella pneumophila subsp. pascullei]AMP94620.1 hypothetical protein AXF37_03045 [Legionella pneumophila subsp. pascullei]SQG89431.1 Uncharacterized protein conserved in bacteria [Legionella pneumophila subsp. pascullei]VEH04697.1 Uncharacterized protein conserved in bacteria [Legionella pneumophila sub